MQGCGDLLVERVIQVIIPSPVFKQVAQYVQRFCLRSDVLGEVQEYFCGEWLFRAQVQVGDKQGVGHIVNDNRSG